MQIIAFVLLAIIAIGVIVFLSHRRKPVNNGLQINANFLSENVPYYAALSAEERQQFDKAATDFLLRTKITGVDTTVSDQEKMLVAAGAVIPMFRFPGWYYANLREVLVYSDSFNHQFESKEAAERNILGMVGDGYLNGTMLLSKPSIVHAFQKDQSNTIIHEFVHLIDKSDGEVDGVPELLLRHQYVIPWVDMIHKQINEIKEGDSDLNPYGITNQAEFFAVASEYFFERPEAFEEKHPELFAMMQKMFGGHA